MVQRALAAQDVHEAEVDPVHRDRPGHRPERLQPADLAEPAARVPRLLQQLQREAARHAQVAAPLLRHPLEQRRLLRDVHSPDPEQLFQIGKGDRRIEIGSVDRGTDTGVRDALPRPVERPQVSRLRYGRHGDRREVGHELGVLGPHRVHHHRIGAADEGAPGLVGPDLKVFRGNEFVADDAAGDRAEARGIAGVDDLLGGGGVEVGRRLRTQDEKAIALGGDGESLADFAIYPDRAMGARRQTLPAANAGLVHDLQQQRIVARHRYRIGRADPHTREAGNALLCVYDEVQVAEPGRWTGESVRNLTAGLPVSNRRGVM